MGIDLKVMASSFRERRGELLATATLRFERDPILFGRLSQLSRPLPDGLKVGSYEDEGLTYTDVDRRGNRLTFCTPADVAALDAVAEGGEWNRAIFAFLRALPSDTRVVLYWC